ncbi:S-methyl-5'-thioadenosine phosphorylase [Pyronema domesticum]|uniref:S-methyl-5'-thioadenosine phosphorylase n=1 Tax=Pyronema omphalodes (strain CBS 100304) TaxID=1076935 RepID=U4KY75_PYROM|nr:S-methyl-5'-thioadenosine phosphorylase [Pyronema domesticum]CCX07147.1 Similar to S-methyl-5' acc. no. D5GFR0 [Pyronema omphalodes CBS 100304]
MSALPTTFSEPVHIAVIGGTGIESLVHDGFVPAAVLTPTTPWGAPSSPINILRTATGVPIAFLSRHGVHHELTPSEVPNLANISALRAIGVRTVLAFSAVGSLQEDIRPRDFVIPDQIIDRTKGIRPHTFFEKGIVGHVGFADPFDAGLTAIVAKTAEKLEGGAKLHVGGTVICMEGPAFSTRAESKMYRSWGGSVINMSALPESKLAREAEMAYVMVCMSTDYDCWKTDEPPVDVAVVMGNMKQNGENAKRVMVAVLEELALEQHEDLVKGRHLEGASKWANCTKPEGVTADARQRIEFLFPGYFN